MRREENWFRQSKADLDAAKNFLRSKNYEWACFAAQHPNAYASGAPVDRFDEKMAQEAITLAEEISVFARD